MKTMSRAHESHCGPSMIAFGGALLITASLAPGLAADVAWSWLSAGTAGLSSAVAISERHKHGTRPAATRTEAPGEALYIVSVLRNNAWFETSAVYTSVAQAGTAALAIRQRLGCETAISVVASAHAVSAVSPQAPSKAGTPATCG